MAGKPFKLSIPSRNIRRGIVAQNLHHLHGILQKKFGLSNAGIFLFDGTLVCDEDYFGSLAPQTLLMVVEPESFVSDVNDIRYICQKHPHWEVSGWKRPRLTSGSSKHTISCGPLRCSPPYYCNHSYERHPGNQQNNHHTMQIAPQQQLVATRNLNSPSSAIPLSHIPSPAQQLILMSQVQPPGAEIVPTVASTPFQSTNTPFHPPPLTPVEEDRISLQKQPPPLSPIYPSHTLLPLDSMFVDSHRNQSIISGTPIGMHGPVITSISQQGTPTRVGAQPGPVALSVVPGAPTGMHRPVVTSISQQGTPTIVGGSAAQPGPVGLPVVPGTPTGMHRSVVASISQQGTPTMVGRSAAQPRPVCLSVVPGTPTGMHKPVVTSISQQGTPTMVGRSAAQPGPVGLSVVPGTPTGMHRSSISQQSTMVGRSAAQPGPVGLSMVPGASTVSNLSISQSTPVCTLQIVDISTSHKNRPVNLKITNLESSKSTDQGKYLISSISGTPTTVTSAGQPVVTTSLISETVIPESVFAGQRVPVCKSVRVNTVASQASVINSPTSQPKYTILPKTRTNGSDLRSIETLADFLATKLKSVPQVSNSSIPQSTPSTAVVYTSTITPVTAASPSLSVINYRPVDMPVLDKSSKETGTSLFLERLSQPLGRLESDSESEDALCIDEFGTMAEASATSKKSLEPPRDNLNAKDNLNAGIRPFMLELGGKPSDSSSIASDEGYVSGTPRSSDELYKQLPFANLSGLDQNGLKILQDGLTTLDKSRADDKEYEQVISPKSETTNFSPFSCTETETIKLDSSYYSSDEALPVVLKLINEELITECKNDDTDDLYSIDKSKTTSFANNSAQAADHKHRDSDVQEEQLVVSIPRRISSQSTRLSITYKNPAAAVSQKVHARKSSQKVKKETGPEELIVSYRTICKDGNIVIPTDRGTPITSIHKEESNAPYVFIDLTKLEEESDQPNTKGKLSIRGSKCKTECCKLRETFKEEGPVVAEYAREMMVLSTNDKCTDEDLDRCIGELVATGIRHQQKSRILDKDNILDLQAKSCISVEDAYMDVSNEVEVNDVIQDDFIKLIPLGNHDISNTQRVKFVSKDQLWPISTDDIIPLQRP